MDRVKHFANIRPSIRQGHVGYPRLRFRNPIATSRTLESYDISDTSRRKINGTKVYNVRFERNSEIDSRRAHRRGRRAGPARALLPGGVTPATVDGAPDAATK